MLSLVTKLSAVNASSANQARLTSAARFDPLLVLGSWWTTVRAASPLTGNPFITSWVPPRLVSTLLFMMLVSPRSILRLLWRKSAFLDVVFPLVRNDRSNSDWLCALLVTPFYCYLLCLLKQHYIYWYKIWDLNGFFTTLSLLSNIMLWTY